MIGDERDSIVPTDDTLAGNAKIRTAQRRIAVAQRAA
jgi:hypothetical protein